MGNYQVLFSGEVASDANADAVRDNLARELGIDERKARQLFSGRTVVLRSQLEQTAALELQEKLSSLGALCRVKDFTPKVAEYREDNNASDYTLRDITAAHLECPRCGHLQLDSSHCARCGVDLILAQKKQRKEDLIIEKKIRELRGVSMSDPAVAQPALQTPEPVNDEGAKLLSPRPRLERVVSWLKGSR
jgi:ribosomal protein S27AE